MTVLEISLGPIIAMQNKNISNLQRKHYTDMQANLVHSSTHVSKENKQYCKSILADQ